MKIRVADFRTRWLRSFGIVMIAVLALGAAGHLWHHVTDPTCEGPGQGFPHPCAQCAGLHAGALAEATQAAAAPRLADLAAISVGEEAERALPTEGLGSPRAPPVG